MIPASYILVGTRRSRWVCRTFIKPWWQPDTLSGFGFFLADGDTVSETNSKVVVLINRLNLFWGLDWEALPHYVRCGRDLPDSDFLISCVDTRAARRI
jgi:hypothetical protein